MTIFSLGRLIKWGLHYCMF